MKPMRAFVLSFIAGLALLFSTHNLVFASTPSPDGTITV